MTATASKIKKLDDGKGLSKYQLIEKWLSERYGLRLNLVSSQIEVKPKGQKEWEEINEAEIIRQLEHNNVKSNQTDVKNILGSHYPIQYDPFLDYFNSLPAYDLSQESEIDKLLSFVKVENHVRKRLNTQFKKWLVRAINTALIPKYFNKQVIILQSEEQNNGKSTFCRSCIPKALEDYYTEHFQTDKDGLFALAENFIINLDELASLQRSEINVLKKFISTVKIKARRAYGHFAKSAYRRTSFIGSTNQIDFLNDETGSVRFIIIPILGIDFNYSKEVDIDKVWAEAFALSKSTDFKAEMSSEELAENEEVNKSFTKQSIERELLIERFEASTDNEDYKTPSQIISMMQTLSPGIRTTPEKVGKALKQLGYEKKSVRKPYPRYMYQIKTKTEIFNF